MSRHSSHELIILWIKLWNWIGLVRIVPWTSMQAYFCARDLLACGTQTAGPVLFSGGTSGILLLFVLRWMLMVSWSLEVESWGVCCESVLVFDEFLLKSKVEMKKWMWVVSELALEENKKNGWRGVEVIQLDWLVWGDSIGLNDWLLGILSRPRMVVHPK